ncbi:MAG TPA: hypothetical protein V6D29_16150 [Leptolyngbyaceae cyanobacterium]
MTAALRKRAPSRNSPHAAQTSRQPRSRRRRPTAAVPLPLTNVQTLTPARPHLQAVPAPFEPTKGLQILSALNAGLSVVSGLLVLSALGAYSYSVYIDRHLEQATDYLARLQRSEQQLTTANEVLKNHIANQAESPSTGLQPPQPTNVIFLKPAQQRVAANPSPVAPTPQPQQSAPLGY